VSEATRDFWQAQPADARGMMLNDSADRLDDLERAEILAMLPPFDGSDVLELGAGVGRYTRHFAQTASSVTAVDFVEAFVAENRRRTASAPVDVVHVCDDAMSVTFPAGAYDLVFVNWLLMYLEDEQVLALLDRVREWLRPGGTFFLRESCRTASDPSAPHPNTHYRDPEFYATALAERFTVSAHANVRVYEQRLANPNQLIWLAQRP
jgi:phosphoethanolamine N-methyltransferase